MKKCEICHNETRLDTATKTTDGKTVCLKDYTTAANYHRKGLMKLKEIMAAHAVLNDRDYHVTKLIRFLRRAAAHDPKYKGKVEESRVVLNHAARENDLAIHLYAKTRSCLEPQEHIKIIQMGLDELSDYDDASGYNLVNDNNCYLEQCQNVYWNDVKTFEAR
jgi:hypothetical protein